MALTFAERLEAVRELIAGRRWILAEEALRPLCERHPGSEAAWRLLGDCLAAQRRYADAEAAYDSALVASPGSVAARQGLARLYAQRSRFDLAGAILDRLPRTAETVALRRRISAQGHDADPSAYFIHLVGEIERAIGENRTDLALAAQADIKRRASVLRRLHWEREPVLGCAAYFAFNPTEAATIHRYRPDWLRAAVEFDFVHWPKRVQRWVEGLDVADIGCGQGAYSLGFVIAGAASYFGVDPTVDLVSTAARNKLRREDAVFVCAPSDIQAALPQVTILPGAFEDMAAERTFDTILMHNVTEHLLDIEAVFEGLTALMRPAGKVIFVHHNYYCWNGHHQRPASLSDLKEDDAEQARYYDWRHVRFEPPADHYIATGLNRIRLADLRALCERLWRIETWDERRSPPEILARMTPELRASLPEFGDDELEVNAVFVVAAAK
ncbi:MAG TPA: tetratricopeptide repeat protein [Caulobacteraceae bacterium]|jgi:SAM-dependent methyltransferase